MSNSARGHIQEELHRMLVVSSQNRSLY